MFTTDRRIAGASALAATLFITCLPGVANASDVTFAVIGPHEYELPVNYQPFNVVVQYGEINSNDTVWDSKGNQQHGTGGSLYVGLTKYVYFFTLDKLPGVGIAAEIIEPEVLVSNSNSSYGGLAGTIFGFAAWIKPDANSTLGVQSFGQAPDGTSRVNTGATWNNLSSILFDHQFKYFDITGNAGVIFRENAHFDNAPAHEKGDVFHVNARFGAKVNPIVEPFLAVDWTTANSDHYAPTGQELVDSAFTETTVGAGVNVALTKKAGFALRYSRGIDGRNTTVTNAAYFKFYVVF